MFDVDNALLDNGRVIAASIEAYPTRRAEGDLPDSTRALIDWARKQELDIRRCRAQRVLSETLLLPDPARSQQCLRALNFDRSAGSRPSIFYQLA